MSKGYPFPDLEKLRRAMALRGWTRAMLAAKAGISPTSAYKVLQGRNCSAEVIEAVARAMLENPARTDTAAFVLSEETA